MAKRQATLFSSWSLGLPAKKRRESEAEIDSDYLEGGRESTSDPDDSESHLEDRQENDSEDQEERDGDLERESEDEDESGTAKQPELESIPRPSTCTALCCISTEKAYQPTDKQTLAKFTTKKRNFQPQWYKQFPWVSVCITNKKAYCLYCRYATQHNLISFSKMGEKAFTVNRLSKLAKSCGKVFMP